MTRAKTAPYGSWESPIKAKRIAQGSLRLMEALIEGGRVFWTEMRPGEGGRYVLMRRDTDGTLTAMIPPLFNARTRVHEYGGGAALPDGDGILFVHFADQRLYRWHGQGEPEPITPELDLRYADLVHDPGRSRVICVREDHTGEGEAVNTVAAICPGEDGRSEPLVHGNDFYHSPRLSPDGSRLAWLTWNHPQMPWDAAELWVAPVRDDGSLERAVHIAGGEGTSAAQPLWSPDGTLYFALDRSGWWNIHRWRGGCAEPVLEMEAEFASPQWIFRMANYGFDGSRRIICSYVQDGVCHLAALDAESGAMELIETPYTSIGSVRVEDGQVVFIGGSASRPTAVVLMDLATGEVEELRRAAELEVDASYFSSPEPVEFPTGGGLTAHGLFYRPRNPDFAALEDEKPPLLVKVHGGPTAATSSALNPGIQYYTSRGFAVLDVNYGGSTGYGRAYRERLYGQWGVVDVDDCCNGALHLARQGLVDEERMAVTGGSAGGYTTLAALAFRDVFAAGASHFGVSDCAALAEETHKFESRYLDQLIGPYPEQRGLYEQRSALHHADGFSCPIIFFQGLEDRIVPPNQARMMVAALRQKGLPVALLEFEGEQHGFRKAENIERALDAEFYFLARIFGFEPADPIEPVPIDNL